MHADSWVAIATGFLALATIGLAFQAYRSGQATQRADRRPMILPSAEAEAVEYDPDEATLRLLVRNAGRGPALYLRTELDPSGSAAVHGAIAAMAVKERRLLTFREVQN